ncbi:SelB translation factor [Luteitalea pratensis]|uniref:Selenocysteine-specific elongation factor n=1 Tax=Luteitalea pratensis TaxID=1855912 RepID=A0A143PQW0_LUTPR|nr:selenocysteine-specific translation elongation factor [Luteitalea pratensis]AMY11002.1 SelB translation factor [Luteitalea pratensis]
MTHLTIATAGHIDHGKSALVQALTGTNPDRLPEEQARGISIELGFAHVTVGDVTLSFVDVPGHERFVRTMLAGVGGIDAVLLVVAADESVMPQTREHFDICRLLDVRSGVIALTRCDLADEMMQAVAESDVQELVAGTPLASAPIVRVSARTGEGLEALRRALVRCGDSRRLRRSDVPARLPIDRAFTVKGFGTVVTGTLWSGSIELETELTLWPAGQAVRVRGLQVHGAPAARADAGQRVAVNLASVALEQVERGHVLLGDGVALSTRRMAVDVEILPDAPAQKHGTRVHVHLGTSVVLGRLILPGREATGEVRVLAPGEGGAALLRLEAPLPPRRGDRLVLRSYSPVTTIGGACVTDPLPPPRMLHRAGTPHEDSAALVLSRVRERGTFGCPEAELPARCGLPPATTHQVIRELEARGQLVSLGSYWVDADVMPEMRATLLKIIDTAHASDPLQAGIPRASLRVAAGRRWRPELVDLVLSRLVREGVVAGDDRIARVAAAPAGRDPLETRVLALIEAAALQGLSLPELEAALPGIDRKGTATMLARLVKTREVERLGDLCVSASRLKGLTDELRRLAGTGEVPARIEVGWFKERYGLTRRAAIPLLEWLDRTRVTRREGEARVLTGT